jgi:hypothetical protein
MLNSAGGKLRLTWSIVSRLVEHLPTVRVRVPRLEMRVISQNLLVHLGEVLAILAKCTERRGLQVRLRLARHIYLREI